MDDPPRLRRRGAGSRHRCGPCCVDEAGAGAGEGSATGPGSPAGSCDVGRAAHTSSRAPPKATRSSNTRRSADRLARGSRQARRTVSAPAAGIDAASKARRCQNNLKKWRVFSLHPPRRRCGRGGRGLFRRRLRHGVGHRWRGIRRRRTRPSHRCRGLKLTERPRKSAVQADFRWPHAEETSPCPPCRRQALDRREAHHADQSRHQNQNQNQNRHRHRHPKGSFVWSLRSSLVCQTRRPPASR